MARHATTTEIIQAYNALDADNLKQLYLQAHEFIPGTQYSEPLDLIHEAFDRALDGRRNWPTNIDFPVFMYQTMRSISSSDRKMLGKALRRNVSLDLMMESGDGGLPCTPSVEDDVISMEQLTLSMRTAELARKAFADDAAVLRVLTGMLAGLSPIDIRENSKLSNKDFDSARHRLMRGLKKLKPD
jgi:hypothetical protein